jgi:predicted  nucleic acid-binding Zn-ribbon protein
MPTFREYEKEIDDIRDKLSRERQELGKEEFDRRQAEAVREAMEKYHLKYADLPSARRTLSA